VRRRVEKAVRHHRSRALPACRFVAAILPEQDSTTTSSATPSRSRSTSCLRRLVAGVVPAHETARSTSVRLSVCHHRTKFWPPQHLTHW
jgi:hypothetical protein